MSSSDIACQTSCKQFLSIPGADTILTCCQPHLSDVPEMNYIAKMATIRRFMIMSLLLTAFAAGYRGKVHISSASAVLTIHCQLPPYPEQHSTLPLAPTKESVSPQRSSPPQLPYCQSLQRRRNWRTRHVASRLSRLPTLLHQSTNILLQPVLPT